MKKIALYCSFIFVFLLLLFHTTALTQPHDKHINSYLDSIKTVRENENRLKNEYLKSEDVVVKKFHTKIDLYPQEGYFLVEENYDIQFNKERHGIYRNIPLVYQLNNVTTSTQQNTNSNKFWAQQPNDYRITIDKIDVLNETNRISGGRFTSTLNIRIGDADKYVSGEKHYTIKYRVKNAILFDDSACYFYWNTTGSFWEFPFLESSFEVHIPNQPNIQYYVYNGYVGEHTTQAQFEYKDGILSGKSNIVLGQGKDMTVLLKLPPTYFKPPTALQLWWRSYGWIIFPFLAFFIFFLIWFIWGRDNKPVKVVEYFPPKDIDPALAGYLTDTDADTKDILSLIPYWGKQGFLKIESLNKEEKTEKKWYSIFPSSNPQVHLGFIYFFGSIFGIYILSTSLSPNYFWYIVSIIGGFSPFIIVALIIIYKKAKSIKQNDFKLYKLQELPNNVNQYENTIFYGLFSEGNVIKMSSLKDKFYSKMIKAKSELADISNKMFFTTYSKKIVILTATFFILYGMIGGILVASLLNIFGGVLLFLTCIGLSFFSGIMRKRVVAGDEALQKVEGFRMFIEKAKKDELTWLLKENPNYFDDTLAYAVAFGFADKYCNKFEGLIAKAPEWYGGNYSHFSMSNFSTSFNATMLKASTTMVSSPASSGSGGSYGGGFSGGGFSGGGFGGGGGGSW
ncbi:MAG: DUF2207 domain-containing protein [Bacteroidetes bacterium]|nr:DUF2207 domain-containing protein [Bacteroidota bacterium]